jgi:hypothetical protein
MKERKRAAPASSPDYHPATGQVLSEVEGGRPYLLKRPSQKTKETNTTLCPQTK